MRLPRCASAVDCKAISLGIVGTETRFAQRLSQRGQGRGIGGGEFRADQLAHRSRGPAVPLGRQLAGPVLLIVAGHQLPGFEALEGPAETPRWLRCSPMASS